MLFPINVVLFIAGSVLPEFSQSSSRVHPVTTCSHWPTLLSVVLVVAIF